MSPKNDRSGGITSSPTKTARARPQDGRTSVAGENPSHPEFRRWFYKRKEEQATRYGHDRQRSLSLGESAPRIVESDE